MKRRVLIMSNNINESNVKKRIEADDKKAAGGQVLVAKVVLSNGRSATYKIATR